MKQSFYNSCENLKDFFCDMLPGTKITEGFTLGSAKASYVICYGLAPFHKEKIMKQITTKDIESPYFVSCVDAAFHSVLNQKQLDVHSWMCILFTLMNTCKEQRDCISILNLWAIHNHLT